MRRRSLALLLLVSMLCLSQTACIGQMALSGKVREFNLSAAEGKWGRELVFLLLYIIPVFPFAGAIDLVIVNSIEFHTGTNPLTNKPRIALREGETDVVAPDGSHASATQRPDGSVDITVTTGLGMVHELRLVPVPGGIEAHDAKGTILGRVGHDGAAHPTFDVAALAWRR